MTLDLSNPAVGFGALLSNDAYLGNSETIKYDIVLKNYGNRCNKWTPHFVTPRRGLYIFNCSVKVMDRNLITVGIIKNSHFILKILSAHLSWKSGSRTVVLTKDKG